MQGSCQQNSQRSSAVSPLAPCPRPLRWLPARVRPFAHPHSAVLAMQEHLHPETQQDGRSVCAQRLPSASCTWLRWICARTLCACISGRSSMSLAPRHRASHSEWRWNPWVRVIWTFSGRFARTPPFAWIGWQRQALVLCGKVIKHSKKCETVWCVGSCVLQQIWFLQWKSTHNHVGGFCNKTYKIVFFKLPLFCCAPLLQINLF